MKLEPTGFRLTIEEGGAPLDLTLDQAIDLYVALSVWLPEPHEHDFCCSEEPPYVAPLPAATGTGEYRPQPLVTMPTAEAGMEATQKMPAEPGE